MAQFIGLSEFDHLFAGIKEMEQKAIEEVRRAAGIITREFFSNTPVWSGETVRNYSWGAGGVPSGGTKAPSGSLPHRGDSSEANRGANESAALSDMDAVIPRERLMDMFLSNLIDSQKWNLIDAGLAPWPGKSRYPGGVEIMSVQAAKSVLKNWSGQ